MTDSNLKLLGIVGSLRKGSLNRALLRALGDVLPAGVSLTIFEGLGDLPHYDGDVDAAGTPPAVEVFKRALSEADGLVFATPEYNYSIPGVLKNAIDWASRPPPSSPLRGKPAGILGASGGSSGTMRAQYHLRQVFVFTNTIAMLQPEMLVPRAPGLFDAEGKLTDGPTREHLTKWAASLVDWVRLHRG